jgi:hypothetical protein
MRYESLVRSDARNGVPRDVQGATAYSAVVANVLARLANYALQNGCPAHEVDSYVRLVHDIAVHDAPAGLRPPGGWKDAVCVPWSECRREPNAQ